MDILPFLYYEKLIDNAFLEFADLFFSVRRIKDGIKKRKIVDIGARELDGKKENVVDKNVRAMIVERRNKRKFKVVEEFVENLFQLSPQPLVL